MVKIFFDIDASSFFSATVKDKSAIVRGLAIGSSYYFRIKLVNTNAVKNTNIGANSEKVDVVSLSTKPSPAMITSINQADANSDVVLLFTHSGNWGTDAQGT